MEKFSISSLLEQRSFDPYQDDYEAGNPQPMRHGGGTPQYAPVQPQQPSARAPRPAAGLRNRTQEATGFRDYVPPADGFRPITPPASAPRPRRAATPDNRMRIRYPLISSGADTANDAPDPLITDTPGVGFQRAPYGDVPPAQRPSGIIRGMRDAAHEAPWRAVDAVVDATRSTTGPLREQDVANQQRESARNIPETGGRPAAPSTATPRARPAGLNRRGKPTAPVRTSRISEAYGVRGRDTEVVRLPPQTEITDRATIENPWEYYGIPQPAPAGAGRTIGDTAGEAGLRASVARITRPAPTGITRVVRPNGQEIRGIDPNGRLPSNLREVSRQGDTLVVDWVEDEMAAPASSGAPRDPGVGMPSIYERRRQRRQ